MSERSNNLRQFLAYLTISQLISGNDISLDQDTEWSISSLTHEFFRLDLSDSGDMYYLYSVMSLFDVVVGSSVDCSERVSSLIDKLTGELDLLVGCPISTV